MIPGLILTWLRGQWRWLLPATACLGLAGALWWQNNTHALEAAKSAAAVSNLETAVANCKAASSQALANAEAQRRNEEREYAQKADSSDAAYDKLRGVYAKALQARVHSSATSGAATGGDPGLPEGASTDTKLAGGVIVSIADMEICTENTAKLESAVEWAVGLSETPLP